MTPEDTLTFLRSCAASDERVRARLLLDSARWRALLVGIVGELNAERMFRDSDHTPSHPRGDQ